MKIGKAQRKKVKLKMGISGPSGSGKTMSALLVAYGLVGDWEKIVVIDTENDSSSLYEHMGPFNVLPLTAPYSPERYIEAIDTCLKAGMGCIIIDSTSHEWSGVGGCLEANELLAQLKYSKNTWAAWSETTPRHDRFVNKILQSDVHIICCSRSKTETVLGEDKKVKKVGMKDIQREGFEYEMSVMFNLDRETHLACVSKDRTSLFEGGQAFIITEETGSLIREWCDKGIDVDAEITAAIEKLENCNSAEDLSTFKGILPLHVINSDRFKLAGNTRFKAIKAASE